MKLLEDLDVSTGRSSVTRLSRGERLRVANARALLFEPGVLVADEPTASLDSENAASIMDILDRCLDETGATFVLVSHDERYLRRMSRVRHMDRGKLAS